MAVSQAYSPGRRLLLLLGGLLIFALGLIPLDPESAAETPPTPVQPAPTVDILARVDDHVITAEQIEDRAAAELLELERRRHEILQAHVEETIRERLLGAAAAAEGLAPEAYAKSRLDALSAEISAEEVAAYHVERGIHQPLEQASEQIRRRLAREHLDAQLEAAHRVERLIEPFRVEVEAVGPTYGPDFAPITIVEFSDFLCPFCGRALDTLEEVFTRYEGQVRLVVRQFPQEIHEESHRSAEAALCADRQGYFWEFHDLAFSDQGMLENEGLEVVVSAIDGLDRITFNNCLESGAARAAVEADLAAGRRLGVQSTPTLFINGRMLSGTVGFEEITALIDDELNRKLREE